MSDSESGEGSYSSPLHSPPHSSPLHSPSRHSESDGFSTTGTTSGTLTGGVPLTTVRQIIATTDVLPFAPDGMYALAKVSELFVEHLLRETMELHDERIDYDELADTIRNDEDLSFLHDFFPTRISFAEAQARAAEKDHEEEEE